MAPPVRGRIANPPQAGREIVKQRADAGFTLVEMLVAIAIIGILVALSATRLNPAKEEAYERAMMSDLRNVAVAQEAYFDTNGAYAKKKQLGIQLSPDVKLAVKVNATGWSARARHKHLPKQRQCALYFGKIKPHKPAKSEGVIACR